MERLKFDLSKKYGSFKILNATNGGPWHKRHASDQYRSNFAAYKAAKIPFSRNHDSGVVAVYGGPYSHDINKIFPDFDADPSLAESYDFACTDESVLVCLDAGTQTYFRLGQTIEHQIKKHGTIPPKDFNKWAVICEHIIRHYNEGWADGFHLNIEYWEIWNEPDLDPDDAANKRCWGGTKAQFFDFYEIAAKHLKSNFPHLKIGGPALAGNEKWAADFLCEMAKREVPIDFFSWHIYTTEPEILVQKAERIKNILIKCGYENAESHLNEWNYVKGWTEEFLYSVKAIHGMKGAAFMMACMSASQSAPIDLLMYYDTRPSAFNGVFDFYTREPLKGYYPMLWYSEFYRLENEIRAENAFDNIYSLCGLDSDGKITAVFTYYTDNDNAENKRIAIDFGREGKYEVYLLDEKNTNTLIGTAEELSFDMMPNSCILLKEV